MTNKISILKQIKLQIFGYIISKLKIIKMKGKYDEII